MWCQISVAPVAWKAEQKEHLKPGVWNQLLKLCLGNKKYIVRPSVRSTSRS